MMFECRGKVLATIGREAIVVTACTRFVKGSSSRLQDYKGPEVLIARDLNVESTVSCQAAEK